MLTSKQRYFLITLLLSIFQIHLIYNLDLLIPFMESKLAKRLLQPTLPNQTSINCELEVCKLVLSSQIQPAYNSAKSQNKKLKQKILNLEWNYTREVSRKQALCRNTKCNQLLSFSPTKMKEEIAKLTNQTTNLRLKSAMLQKKVADRQQLMISDQKYWRSLKIEKEDKEKQLKIITDEKEKLLNKKQKMQFVRKEMLRNQSTIFHTFDSISRQKINIRQKLQQKYQQLKNKLFSIQNKRDIQRKKIVKIQSQSNSLVSEIKIIESKLQKMDKQKQKQVNAINKMEKHIFQEQNTRFQLKQKLKIHSQHLDQIKQTKKRLENSKQQIQRQTRQFLQMTSYIQSQIKKIEAMSNFQTEHVFRLLSMQ